MLIGLLGKLNIKKIFKEEKIFKDQLLNREVFMPAVKEHNGRDSVGDLFFGGTYLFIKLIILAMTEALFLINRPTSCNSRTKQHSYN